jgi:hypothetical protein
MKFKVIIGMKTKMILTQFLKTTQRSFDPYFLGFYDYVSNCQFKFWLFFVHNLNFKSSNEECEFIFYVYTSSSNGPKSALLDTICYLHFWLKFLKHIGTSIFKVGKLFENVEIHFSTPLGVCLNPKTLSQIVSSMFSCLGHECNVRVAIHPSCHNVKS